MSNEIEGLNPGIRRTVALLSEWGLQWGYSTTDSGDGATHDYECDLDEPYVGLLGPADRLVRATDDLAAFLERRCAVCVMPMSMTHEPGTVCVQGSYDPADKNLGSEQATGAILVFGLADHDWEDASD